MFKVLKNEQGHSLLLVTVIGFIAFMIITHMLTSYVYKVKTVQLQEQALRANVLVESAVSIWLAENIVAVKEEEVKEAVGEEEAGENDQVEDDGGKDDTVEEGETEGNEPDDDETQDDDTTGETTDVTEDETENEGKDETEEETTDDKLEDDKPEDEKGAEEESKKILNDIKQEMNLPEGDVLLQVVADKSADSYWFIEINAYVPQMAKYEAKHKVQIKVNIETGNILMWKDV